MSVKQTRKESILHMLQNEPNDVFLNYALAMEYLGENDFSHTESQLQKVLALNKDYLPCYYQMGQVKEKLGAANDAIFYYKKGIELATSQQNTKALGELKEALWMLED